MKSLILVCAIFISIVHVSIAIEGCSNFNHIISSSLGTFKSRLLLQAPRDMVGYRLRLEFTSYVSRLLITGATQAQAEDSEGPPFIWEVAWPERVLAEGEPVEITFEGMYPSSSPIPQMSRVVLSGYEMCSGIGELRPAPISPSRPGGPSSVTAEAQPAYPGQGLRPAPGAGGSGGSSGGHGGPGGPGGSGGHGRGCNRYLTITDREDGSWTGTLSFPAPEPSRGWSAQLKFNGRVNQLYVGSYGQTTVQNQPGSVWTVSDETSRIRKGDTITLQLTVSYSRANTEPGITHVNYNGQQICPSGGESGGGGGGSQGRPPSGQRPPSPQPTQQPYPTPSTRPPAQTGYTCSRLLRVTSRDKGQWAGTLSFRIPESSRGWSIQVRFSNFVDHLYVVSYGRPKVQHQTGNIWTVTESTSNFRGGDTLSLDLTVTYQANRQEPTVILLTYNGQQICGAQSGSGGGSLTYPENRPRPTEAPTPKPVKIGSCRPMVRVASNTAGEWRGDVSFRIPNRLSGWELELEFDKFVSYVYADSTGNPTVQPLGGGPPYVWLVSNPNQKVQAGEAIEVGLVVQYPRKNGNPYPRIIRIELNRVDICRDQVLNSRKPVDVAQEEEQGYELQQQELQQDAICGLGAPLPVTYIFQGQRSAPGEWPWHASIFQIQPDKRSLDYSCGGTLVTPTAVITAAHCVMDQPTLQEPVQARDLAVVLGLQRRNWENEPSRQLAQVSNIILHPSYNPQNRYNSDLAVLRLGLPATLTPSVQPVCLGDPSTAASNQMGVFTGWSAGSASADPESDPDVLRVEAAPVVEDTICLSSNPEVYGKLKTENTFCAEPRNGSAITRSDPGTGLVVSQNGQWFLRGVESVYPTDRAILVSPGQHGLKYAIFTDVTRYLPWLTQYL